MRKLHLISLAAIMLMAFSTTAIFAQTATETSVPPPVFTDGRINGTVNLGGLALYCVDNTGNTHVAAFDSGAITVWGIADQKYINLNANQLRGNVEIPQMPSQMQMEAMTEAAPDMAATAEATEMEQAAATVMPEGQSPILLARAMTPNGEIGFFTTGGDQFALQGYDQTGKFFTYIWTGCNTGTLDNTTLPYLPNVTMQPTEMMTPEATAAS